MLIIFGGLPGTGKTTLSKLIAKQLKAVYLRVDTVEQALKKCSNPDHVTGPEGYMVCYALALDNLKLGLSVVADSVNSIAITRNDWQKVAKNAQHPFIEIELICSDPQEHQHRIESRKADIPGHKLPKWIDVVHRDYEPWQSKSMTLDTSEYSVHESVTIIMDFINKNH